jgi:enoyl-CoA hydratase/carnithine racemase
MPPAAASPAAAERMLASAATGSEEFLGALDGSAILLVDVTGSAALEHFPPPWLPCVVVAASWSPPDLPAPLGSDVALCPNSRGPVPDGWVAVADVDAALESLAASAQGAPLAAVTLAQVIRAGSSLDVLEGLVLESFAYSTLQSGPEFASWLAGRAPRAAAERTESSVAVVTERFGEELTITLNRPHVRNALNRRMRDQLCEALSMVLMDPSIRTVHVRGAGPVFSSGGDLDEFGTFPDPATGHLTRVARSPARLLAVVAERVHAHLNGPCVGAGIELAAFASRVEASSDATFQLPELSLGLLPGAGGTVSIRRRIGPQRTTWMGLSGAVVDTSRAVEWGLVDEVADPPR